MNLINKTLAKALVVAIAAAPVASAGQVYFIGTGPSDVWQDPANWTLSLPEAGDLAYVGASVQARNSFVYLEGSVFNLAYLSITDGMAVRTDDALLYLTDGLLEISGRNQDDENENLFWPSRLIVEDTPVGIDAWFENALVQDEASLVLEDGATVKIERLLQTDPTAGTYGLGMWSFERDDVNQLAFDNQGYLSGQPGVSTIEQLGASRFDLDGSNGGETGRINATIGTINDPLATTLIFNGTALADDFDGEMWIADNGRIEMNMSSNWTLGDNGLLRFNGAADETPTLAGSTMTVLGEIDANARNAVIEANVWIQNGSHTTVAVNDALTFTGNTIANAALFTVNDGGTLDFAGPLNAQGNGFNLNGGTVTGGIIQNTGTYGFRGYGTIDNRVINDAVFYAENGTLLVNGTQNDWDGIGNAGDLRASGGDLHLTDSQDFSFAGDMRAFPGDEIFIDGFGFELASAGYMYLWNATLRATDSFLVAGSFDSIGNVDVEADVTFMSTSTTIAGEALNMLQDATVLPGASISGAQNARLVGGAAGELELAHGAVTDVTVAGHGVTHVQRFTAGEATVNGDFILVGTLALQAGPPVPLNFDRLIVADTFEARGVIEVTPLLAYQYQLGDEYDVLDFTTFVDLGYTMDLPPLAVDKDWDTSDFETDGVLRIDVDTCRADVNDDGFVNFGDILMVIGAWNTGNISIDVDQNGVVGMSDIFEIIAAWGVCP